jgi:polar amino acid transport system substrate-binding protein
MKLMTGLIFIFMTSLAAFLQHIDFPKDAEKTLDKVSNGTIRVGFTNAAPWVYPSASGAKGIEAGIVTSFAATLHAKVEWIEGTEEQLYTALRRNEIDILIGGITDETPWKQEIGLTKPYLETSIVVAQPSSQALGNQQASIEGQSVAVKTGTDEGYFIRKKKAKPYYTTQLPAINMLSVGYDWQVQNWKMINTGIVLKKEGHVIAVPPGENAFLLALDKYLFDHKDAIKSALNH